MQQQLNAKFPQWVSERGNYDLCMSDDLDSLLSCLCLNQIFGYDVRYFYTFKDMFYIPDMPKKETVCVDIAVEKGKTWDNHVVKVLDTDIVNLESANLNAINGIHKDNYFTKYAGSTLLQIISYYNIPLPESETARLILLAIDSSYLGHYNDNFRATHTRYMEQLELFDLIDVLERNKSPEIFDKLNRLYNLKKKIVIGKNGKLETTIDLAAMQGLFDLGLNLPEEEFVHKLKFSKTGVYPANISKPDVFSFALTGRDKFKYTKV